MTAIIVNEPFYGTWIRFILCTSSCLPIYYILCGIDRLEVMQNLSLRLFSCSKPSRLVVGCESIFLFL